MKRLLVVVGLIAAIVILKLTLFKADPLRVDVYRVELGRVEETVTNSRAGTVKARRRAKLSPESGGQVIAIPFREGEKVLRGDILLRIEDSLQRARLALSERDLDALAAEQRRACLEAERAGRELDRNRRLAQEEIVSKDLLDQVESLKRTSDAACDAARAGVARAEANISLMRAELEKTIIRAPFDGIIADVATEVGEWTTPSPPALPVPPILDLLDPSSLYISAPMDEVDSARITVDQPARVTIDSHRDRVFDGHVIRIAPFVLDIEAQNRTVEIEVELNAGDTVFLPGTSADVEIILSVRRDVRRIPTAALMEGRRVLVLDGSELVERQVETGLRNWDFTEVVVGLEEGELVVTSLDRPEVAAGVSAIPIESEPD